MIIIEGPNNSGKTTLAKKLARILNYHHVHEGPPPQNIEPLKYYAEKALTRSLRTVLDRFHLGNCVYPHLKPGRKPFKTWEQHLIERILLAKGALLLCCSANIDFLRKKHDELNENFIKKDQIQQEIKLFETTIQKTILPMISMPLYHNNRFIEYVLSFYDSLCRRSAAMSSYECSGNIYGGKIMLVGNQYGDGSYIGTSRKQAFAYHSNSSAYLHQVLELTKLNQQDFYITNAIKTSNDFVNKEMVHNENAAIKPGIVIALGKKAADLLKRCNIRHELIPHPQYYLRFKHDKILEYAKLIKEKVNEKYQSNLFKGAV